MRKVRGIENILNARGGEIIKNLEPAGPGLALGGQMERHVKNPVYIGSWTGYLSRSFHP